MSLSVFVDTSAWIALINKSDVFHLKAKTIRDVLIRRAQCERYFIQTPQHKDTACH